VQVENLAADPMPDRHTRSIELFSEKELKKAGMSLLFMEI
jgi:hypothetical protein